MATIQEFIVAKLTRYNIELSDIELAAALTEQGLIASDEYSAAAARPLKLVIVALIPELLLMPDVTEGGYANKWDKVGIKAYYSLLCKELGIKDELAPARPIISNASSRW